MEPQENKPTTVGNGIDGKEHLAVGIEAAKDVSKGFAQVPVKERPNPTNPDIAPAFIKNVTKEQLYRFYPDADRGYLDGLHEGHEGQESTGAGVTGRSSVTSAAAAEGQYKWEGDVPAGKTLRKVTAGYLKKNPDVAALGVKEGDEYPM